MKSILRIVVPALAGLILSSATAQTVGQYELRKRGATGFTSYGVTLSNGQVIGLTADVPAAITPLLPANNLSDLTSAATARTNLGLVISTNVQAYDADLTTWAGITPSANVQSLNAAATYTAFRNLLTLGEAQTAVFGNVEASTFTASTAHVAPAFSLTGGFTTTIEPTATANRSLFTPDASGTIITTGNLSDITGITNAQLANSTITINGSAISLGGSVSNLQTTTGALALAGFSSITGTLPLANIAQGGASSGQVLTWNGSAWAPAAGGGGLTIGTTTITSGTSGRVLYNNSGVVGEMTTSGSGTQLALTTSPTFTTPTLGAATATTINTLSLRADNTGLSTYIGYEAGSLALTTDTKCTALGYQALKNMTGSGSDSANSAFGYRSLTALTTGKSNTGVGDGTLFSETTGNNNTAIGVHALLSQNGGGNNVAIGYNTADGLTTGTNNTAIGYNAMGAVVTGSYNVAIGISALNALTSGGYNVAICDRAGNNITTGSSNVCIGLVAGFSISTTSNNVCIGQSAGQSTTGSGGVYIGFEAGKNETAGNKLYIDNSSTTTPLIGGDFSANTVAIGGSLAIGSGGSAIGVVKRTSATLVGGTVTVSDTATTANSHIVVTVLTPGGTVGVLDFDVSAGSSYTINSSSVLDTSTVIITAIHYP